MHIVFGTDFSEQATSATTAAVALAARIRGAKLSLVHVLDPSAKSLDARAFEAMKAAAEKRVREAAGQAALPGGAAIDSVVLVGAVSETLLDFAATKQAQLLIVTSQGHSNSALYRLGGTSERIAVAAPIPMLVIRDSAPFAAWARGERALRVLLGVDWTRSCDAAIRWVKELRRAGDCDVVVGHVYCSDFLGEGSGRYGLPWRDSFVEKHREAEGLLARDLATRVGDLGEGGKIQFRPMHGIGRFGDHLLNLAESEQIDLIVVGTHHARGLARLASVAAVTLHHGHASVAIVPVPEGEIIAPDEVPTIRRVLVPTELTAFSNYAVPFAYTLFGGRPGEVCLLHVLPHRAPAADDTEIVSRLRATMPKRGVPANVSTFTEVVRHESAARAILEAAERLGADAICMGSHGRSGVRRAVLGSVAEAVLRESRRPVFIARPLPE